MSLILENFHMKYLYGAVAVSHLSLECKKGERIAVLAPSEGGKTSLLKGIAGLYPITEGKILLNGKDITNAKVKDRDVLMIYQNEGFFPYRTVKYHLEYPLKIRKIPKEEREILIKKTAEKFKLTPLLKIFTRLLSNEEKIRLSFARADIRNASLYLIDDPFSGTEHENRERMFQEMLPQMRELNGVVVYTTTTPDEAFTFGERVIVLHYGIVEQIGTPEEIINSPASLTVDRMVNKHHTRILATVEADDEGLYITVMREKLRLSIDPSYIGKEIYVSYTLIEDREGELAMPYGYSYKGDSLYVNFVSGGILRTTAPIQESYRIKICFRGIKIFDENSEKLLATIN